MLRVTRSCLSACKSLSTPDAHRIARLLPSINHNHQRYSFSVPSRVTSTTPSSTTSLLINHTDDSDTTHSLDDSNHTDDAIDDSNPDDCVSANILEQRRRLKAEYLSFCASTTLSGDDDNKSSESGDGDSSNSNDNDSSTVTTNDNTSDTTESGGGGSDDSSTPQDTAGNDSEDDDECEEDGKLSDAYNMTPNEIIGELDRFVIGQSDAKKAVAVSWRARWRRRQLNDDYRREVTPKNILMMGPTGCGKTEVARRLARVSKAPFVKVEATKFTEVGYVGKDVNSIIEDLVANAANIVKARRRKKMENAINKKVEETILKLLMGKSPSRDVETFRKQLRMG